MNDAELDLHRRLVGWAVTKPTVRALHIFGSRARGDYRDDSDLDIALELDGKFGELEEFVSNRSRWKAELSHLTGMVVKDLELRSTSESAAGKVVTVYERVDTAR